MKTPFLIVAALLGSADAFSTPASGLSGRPTLALKDAAIVDPIIEGGVSGVTDQVAMYAGGAAAAVAAGLAAVFGSKNGAAAGAASGEAADEPEPIDVSIPYNAAAMLAFKETKLPQSKFEEFEALYLAKSVAHVTARKMVRDVAEMEKMEAKLEKDMESLSA